MAAWLKNSLALSITYCAASQKYYSKSTVAIHSEIGHDPQPRPEHRFFSGKHFHDTYPTAHEAKDSPPLPIFAPVDLNKPDSAEALSRLVHGWGDQDPHWVLKNGDRVPQQSITSNSPIEEISKIVKREVHLYSHGKRLAIATFYPEKSPTLRVVADQNKLALNQDGTMLFFNKLLTDNRAWVAGKNERNLEEQKEESTHSTDLLPQENPLELIAASDD